MIISDNSKINMIKQQLRTGNVLDESILALFDKVAREDFVPPDMHSVAYSDLHIPIAHNEYMLTPLETGLIMQSLNLQGHETILEIGTGTGFLTALLALKGKQVLSVDYYSDLSKVAAENLRRAGVTNVELVTGNGSSGWIDKAPYDIVVFTGALDRITESHKLQVMPQGKLFAIIGEAPVMQGQLHTLDIEGQWEHQLLFETCVPSLINPLKTNEFVF